jgi:hypothetical protein
VGVALTTLQGEPCKGLQPIWFPPGSHCQDPPPRSRRLISYRPQSQPQSQVDPYWESDSAARMMADEPATTADGRVIFSLTPKE